MKIVILVVIHRSQICKVLCGATGQEPHKEAGGRSTESSEAAPLTGPTTPPSQSVSFILKQACAHTYARRSDSALKLMEMGYILPLPSTAAEHTGGQCRSSTTTNKGRDDRMILKKNTLNTSEGGRWTVTT